MRQKAKTKSEENNENFVHGPGPLPISLLGLLSVGCWALIRWAPPIRKSNISSGRKFLSEL